MNTKEKKKISYDLKNILRFNAKKYNIDMFNDGWVNTKDILSIFNINIDTIIDIVFDSNISGNRFELSEDNSFIRAINGHSTDMINAYNIHINNNEFKPSPNEMYIIHYTYEKNLDSIKEKGLNSGSRTDIHCFSMDDRRPLIDIQFKNKIPIKISIKKLKENGYIISQVKTGTILVSHLKYYGKSQIIQPEYLSI